METKHEYKLTFGTNKGAEITITVPRADETKTIPDLQIAMSAIIAASAIQTAGGEPDSIRHAELVTTGTRNYEVA